MEIDLNQITSEMDELKDTKARLQFELKQVEKQIEERTLTLIAVCSQAGVKEMNYQNYTFGLKTQQRKALNQKLLKEKYPEQYNACYEMTEKEQFYFKIG